MKVLSHVGVLTKMVLIVVMLVAAMTLAGVFSIYKFSGIAINGELYSEIVSKKDFVADLLPPPLFIVESYAHSLRLAGEADQSKVSVLVDDLTKLRKDFEARKTYWMEQDLPPHVKRLIGEAAYKPGVEFFNVVFNEVLPLVKSNDNATAVRVAWAKLPRLFDEHKKAIDELADIVNNDVTRLEKLAASSIRETMIYVLVLAAVLIGLAICLAFVVAGTITKPLHRLVVFADGVTQGDLEQQLDVEQGDEVGVLASKLRSMVGSLKALLDTSKKTGEQAREEAQKARLSAEAAEKAQQEIVAKQKEMLHVAARLQDVAEIVTSSSDQLSVQVEQSSQGAREQVRRVEDTAASMDQMNGTVLEVAQSAGQAAETTDMARIKATEGAKVVLQVVKDIGLVKSHAVELKNDMGDLGRQAQGIGQILNVISDIADQTNLLALNAAIEAARAGDAGRGFAVVADEVRKLAEKTMTATREVGEAIEGIQRGTAKNIENVERTGKTIEDVTAMASKSGQALEEIVALVDEASDQVRTIASASERQSSASEDINRSIDEVNRISSETAEAMRQSASAVGELASQAHVLQDLVHRMADGSGSALPAGAARKGLAA